MKKNKRQNSFPKNMSIREASEFWDEHSLFEFEGAEEVKVEFNLKKKRYVGIDSELLKKVEAQARKRAMSTETLLESWIAEKINLCEGK
jgi:hypothetical protein